MAKNRHTPDQLAKRVAVELLKMPSDSKAALTAKYAGWTIPMNYQPVHDCLRVLNLGPYKNPGQITWRDIFRAHWKIILLVAASGLGMMVCLVVLIGFTRRIKSIQRNLVFERQQLLSILDSIDEIIYIADMETHKVLFANNRLRQALGKDPVGGIC